MTHNTAIEWTHIPGYTGETWNPVVGCSVISPGCTNCYAMRVAGARLDGNPAAPHYAGTTMATKAGPVWTGKIGRASDRTLTAPLRWKKPRAIFVNSMGDLFHEAIPDDVIDQVFAVMALCPQHVFIVLTKRAARMRAYLSENDMAARTAPLGAKIMEDGDATFSTLRWQQWPLPNVWLGVSVEDQARADERIPHLLATPAAVRFLSAEPLLGPVDLEDVPWPDSWERPIDDISDCISPLRFTRADNARFALDWVIAGGESGRGARPMHPDWARALRDQCARADVPFFFKQWGEWAPWDDDNWSLPEFSDDVEARDRVLVRGGVDFLRVGKKAAGRRLDGVTHDAFPAAAAQVQERL